METLIEPGPGDLALVPPVPLPEDAAELQTLADPQAEHGFDLGPEPRLIRFEEHRAERGDEPHLLLALGYRAARARLIERIRTGLVDPDYAVAAATRLDPPEFFQSTTGKKYKLTGVESPESREARVACALAIHSQVRRGEPTLLLYGSRCQGGIPDRDGLTLRSESAELYVGERGYRRLLEVGIADDESVMRLRDMATVSYQRSPAGETVTATPNLQIVSGTEAVLNHFQQAIQQTARGATMRALSVTKGQKGQERARVMAEQDRKTVTDLVAAIGDIGWEARQLVPATYLEFCRSLTLESILVLGSHDQMNEHNAAERRRAALAYHGLFTPEERQAGAQTLADASNNRVVDSDRKGDTHNQYFVLDVLFYTFGCGPGTGKSLRRFKRLDDALQPVPTVDQIRTDQ